MHEIHDILVKAKAMIEDPSDWSSWGWGRDGKRCALHAIYDAAPEHRFGCVTEDFFTRFALYGGAVGAYNDSHTHADVMKKFDKAIAIAKKRGL